MKLIWKLHKDMKIGSKELEENTENVQEALLRAQRLYETAYKEEEEN